ncbi:MAG TPA: disulfide oxidoreductase [Candidatus Acidoferrales bacterium]|nr:disulfide oxidoreductase [Candidatus Acidoferrales bacterium]
MVAVSSFSIITTGYAVLALIADAMVVVVVMGFLLTRTSPASRETWRRFRDAVTPFTLHLAWIVAMLATLGSLYLSQIANLTPCEFCWFQRICMYPLSLLLGIAAFRGDTRIAKKYFLTLSIVGAALATYHYQLEHIAGEPTVCGAAVPCDMAAFNIFGFISVPFLSLAAFLLITTLLLLGRTPSDEEDEDDSVEDGDTIELSDTTLPATA